MAAVTTPLNLKGVYIMTYSKLTIDQKNELRERLFDECFHHECYDCTDFDHLSAEEQKIVYDCDWAEDIPDSVMESAYGMYDFVVDDFFCTAGMYELEEDYFGDGDFSYFCATDDDYYGGGI